MVAAVGDLLTLVREVLISFARELFCVRFIVVIRQSTQHKADEMAEQTEDLKAFERRLTEVIDKLQPAARGWRMLLIVISILTAVGAWAWLWDPRTSQVTFMQSLLYHPVFAISCFTLLLLFLFGIHKRVVAPSIIASRCRFVLGEYNMSCDDTGKLILKPRPST